MEEYVKPIATDILKLFDGDAHTYTAWRQTALLAHLDNFVVSGSDDLLNEMLLCAENSLKAAEFSWVCPPLPNAADYANCNVIESVINAADISVNEAVSQINKAADCIRKTWFDRISAEASMVEKHVTENFNRKQEDADRKLNAQITNYHYFENEVQTLFDKCSRLSDEVFLQEG